eukprot:1194169-Prorocentrum_minimum.AAC.4
MTELYFGNAASWPFIRARAGQPRRPAQYDGRPFVPPVLLPQNPKPRGAAHPGEGGVVQVPDLHVLRSAPGEGQRALQLVDQGHPADRL